MKIATCFISALILVMGMTPTTWAKDKHHAQRAMLERMEAVPCGANQKGLTGLGSLWASVGVTNVHSDEKLCQQYMLRSDDMEYHIRPFDTKHPIILPVGQEAVFKIKKDRMFLRMADADMKARQFHVVAMKPVNADSDAASSTHRMPEKSTPDKALPKPAELTRPEKTAQPPTGKAVNTDNAAAVPNPGPGR